MIRISRFQSTLPRGSDAALHAHFILSIDISIHAPSRERLGLKINKLMQALISIHAPSRERLLNLDVLLSLSNFNPRSLAGATHACLWINLLLLFQSTLPRGSDIRSTGGGRWRVISIHAPSRERRSAGSSCGSSSLFQSTLPRGSDDA